MQGHFNVHNSSIRIPFDTGATISVISLSVVVKLGLQRTLMDEIRFIKIAGKNIISTNEIVKGYPLELGGHRFLYDRWVLT